MFQNMLAILCGWAWNEKLQQESMELHLGDACCKSFKNFRKNKKMKGVKGQFMFLTLHPIWIHKSFVLTTYIEVGEELTLDRRGNIQDSHVFLILIHHIHCANSCFPTLGGSCFLSLWFKFLRFEFSSLLFDIFIFIIIFEEIVGAHVGQNASSKVVCIFFFGVNPLYESHVQKLC